MTASHSFIADAIAGQSEAEKFLWDLNPCTAPDALAQELIKLASSDDPPTRRLHGFCRAIQKKFERLAVIA